MSKVLKWILYVVLGLIALAIIAGIVFAIFGGLGHGYYMMRPGLRMMQPYRDGFGYYRPMGGIFGGLLGLGIFVLIIIGIVALVNVIMRGNRPAQVTQSVQPTQPAPAAEMAVPTRTCSNCGKPAQDDWTTCPYCGNPLT
jgi:zinc-ribbon domain